jgi:beta-galactosidase
MNGANFDKAYQPQTSSYDYDAALDESGRPTTKYFAFRGVIAAHNPAIKLPNVPQVPPSISIEPFELNQRVSLWDNLGNPISSESPATMEMLGQSYGYTLYHTHVAGAISGELKLDGMQDYAKVYVNGVEQGTLDRRLSQSALTIRTDKPDNTLDIIVENGGRINFSKHLRSQRKGLAPPVTFAGKELHGWQIYPLPMSDVQNVRFSPADPGKTAGPGFLHGTFSLTATGDTYLNLRGYGKGVVWVNGHLLGRFWDVGPQQTLYLPAPWLKVGQNEVIVFNLDNTSSRMLQGLVRPLYGN